MGWNYGDMYDGLAEVVAGDAPALKHVDGDGNAARELSWSDFTRRTNNLARQFRDVVATGAKVAFYMRNHPAYGETLAACFKGRLTHVNVNYRYLDEELWYILDNSDAEIVVYGSEFIEQVSHLKGRLPEVKLWVEVPPAGEEDRSAVDFAASFENLAEAGDGQPLALNRSPDDMLFLYTGGTTGMPKGVMWSHENQWLAGGGGASPLTGDVAPADLGEHCRNVRTIAELGMRPIQVPACPQMHGTGMFTAMGAIANGGCIVTMEGRGFDAEQLWKTVEKHRVTTIAIVGDAFAKPMLNVLRENPGRFDISSLMTIVSSGVMWSTEVKRGLLDFNREMVLVDSFGSSEAVGFGRSDMTGDGEIKTAKFTIGENCKVFTEDFREVAPGSGEPGFIARTGPIPVGYYKDEEKTKKTFPVIDGVRYSMPGDFCTVESDGTITLLGRGSVCINTAGEKVYPEEVEEVLKTHPAVDDALVVGVPDEKWGQSVTGVVQLRQGENFDEAVLREYVHGRLAGYKAPKRILAIADLGRAANGKADYKGVTEYAKRELGVA